MKYNSIEEFMDSFDEKYSFFTKRVFRFWNLSSSLVIYIQKENRFTGSKTDVCRFHGKKWKECEHKLLEWANDELD
jgi:hypothetical protein